MTAQGFKRLVAGSLVLVSVIGPAAQTFASSPQTAAAQATPTAARAPQQRVEQGTPIYEHRNYYQRVTMVEDRSRPRYTTRLVPVMGPDYGWRTERVFVGYELVPVMGPDYGTRRVDYLIGYRTQNVQVGQRPIYGQVPVSERRVPRYQTVTECVERFRGRCVQYTTYNRIVGWDVQVIYGRAIIGWEPIYEPRQFPVYGSRMETVKICDACKVVGYDRVPQYRNERVWVKICDNCVVEGYKEVRTLNGYEMMEALTGPRVVLNACPGTGDCNAKSDVPHAGAMYRYVGHENVRVGTVRVTGVDAEGCPAGQERALDGTCYTPSCPAGQERALNGTCYTPESSCPQYYYVKDGQCVRENDRGEEVVYGVCDDTELARVGDLQCRGNEDEQQEQQQQQEQQEQQQQQEQQEQQQQQEQNPPPSRSRPPVRPS